MPLQVIAGEQEHKLATINQEELLRREREEISYQEREKSNYDAVAVRQRGNEFDVMLLQFYHQNSEE